VVDQIQSTHQQGMRDTHYFESGIKDAYKAKVKDLLNNWNAQSEYKGHSATIKLTIYGSGHFRYTILRSSSGSMSQGLESFLEQLNRIGLGTHRRSQPYVFDVTFRAR